MLTIGQLTIVTHIEIPSIAQGQNMLCTSTYGQESELPVRFGDTRCRDRIASVFVLLICAACMLFCTSDSLARENNNKNRNNKNRSAAAKAKEQREKTISNLQKQVINARQILQKAEDKTPMTKAELNSATAKLAGIREEIDSTHQDAVAAAKTLREIEAELLLDQAPDSEYAKAQATVDELKNVVHQTIHKVLDLPLQQRNPDADPRREDLKRLTSSQLSILQENQSYLDAETALKDASRAVSHIRQKLFQDDSEWVAAHEDLINAKHDTQEGEKERRATGTDAAGNKKELENLKNVAQTARSIIAKGESRLRQLGASVPQQKSSSSSGSSTRGKK